jgi:signal transduction histidine kinase
MTPKMPFTKIMQLARAVHQREILYGIVFLMIQAVLIVPLWQYIEEKRHVLERHKIETLRNAYNISVESYNKTAELFYGEVINRPEILRWVAQAQTSDANYARQQLYDVLKDTHNTLQQFDLQQLHFHLSDGTSFLRFHRPDKFGDKMFDVRYSIQLVNTLKKPVHGFEEGKIFNCFRYVFPLFYENQHIGSFDVSVAFSAIEKSMKQVISSEFMLMLKKQVITSSVFSTEQNNYRPVILSDDYVEEISALNEQSSQDTLFSLDLLTKLNTQLRPKVFDRLNSEQNFIVTTRFNDKDYLATFIPIENIRRQVVGYLVSYSQSNELTELQEIFYERYAELSLMNIVMFIFIILLLRNRDRIASQNTHLNQLMLEKNELMGIVAHDLKNPLSAIKGYAEELRDEASSMELAEIQLYAGKIEDSSQRMFSLISNLLDVNVVESGKLKIVMQKAMLENILAECITRQLDHATRKGIKIELSGNSCQIETDTQLFHQVMDNLISNAIKYSYHNTQVNIRIQMGDGKTRCIVEDQGPGLSVEDHAKLFGKFNRLTPVPTAGEHSTGLGLFIVKKLVNALGGQIWCESELGHGSRFIVQLQCCCSEEPVLSDKHLSKIYT